jgi:hypothetical protein
MPETADRSTTPTAPSALLPWQSKRWSRRLTDKEDHDRRV